MTMQLVRPMAYADVEAGMTIPPRSFTVQRRDLIRYAGSACDYNGIHWDDRLAADVGLPSPIAHGMFSMGLALTALTASRIVGSLATSLFAIGATFWKP